MPGANYTYDPLLHRFIGPRGTPLAWSTVRRNFGRVLAKARADVAALSRQLRAGEITLAAWQRAMAQQVKIIHVTSAVARGGVMQMSQGDWGFVGSRIKDQYEYLRNFAQQIEDGAQPLNGVIDRRAQMYADAGRATQEAVRRRMMGQMGVEEERRHLSPVENCPDCVEYAGRGWQPIGTLPEISDSRCLVRCACYFQYRPPSGEVME